MNNAAARIHAPVGDKGNGAEKDNGGAGWGFSSLG